MIFFILTFVLSYFLQPSFCFCPNDEIEWNSQCYHFYSNLTGFEAAELSCIKNGGHLASIHDAFTNGLLAQEANNYFHESTETDFWIGSDNLMSSGNWTWTDGTPFDFIDWKQGGPQNISGANCAALSLIDGTWGAQDCFKSKPFVCGITIVAPTTTIIATTYPSFVNCSDGWTYFPPSHSCYGAAAKGLVSTWTEAEKYCENLNAKLPSVHSFEEDRFLRTYNYVFWNNFWLGLYSLDEGKTWKWSDGSSMNYVSWETGQPANGAYYATNTATGWE